jgi:nicotinamide-nucleotide amidase
MKSLTDMSLAVAQLLKQRGETVAVAETSTGGLISSALLAVPGASAYYKGGSVIYTLESRKQLRGPSSRRLGRLLSWVLLDPQAHLMAWMLEPAWLP